MRQATPVNVPRRILLAVLFAMLAYAGCGNDDCGTIESPDGEVLYYDCPADEDF